MTPTEPGYYWATDQEWPFEGTRGIVLVDYFGSTTLLVQKWVGGQLGKPSRFTDWSERIQDPGVSQA